MCGCVQRMCASQLLEENEKVYLKQEGSMLVASQFRHCHVLDPFRPQFFPVSLPGVVVEHHQLQCADQGHLFGKRVFLCHITHRY